MNGCWRPSAISTTQDIKAIKLQLLHILKGNRWQLFMSHDPFPVFTLEGMSFTSSMCGNHPSGYGYSHG